MAHVFSGFLRRYDAAFDARPVATMMVTNTVLNAIADATAQTVTSIRERPVRSAGSKPAGRISQASSSSGIHAAAVVVGEAPPRPFDWERLCRFMAWGCIVAPFQFKWFQFLSLKFPIRPSSGASSSVGPLVKRVGLDQAAFAPVGLAGFFTWMTVTEGGGVEEVRRKFENVYLKALYGISLSLLPPDFLLLVPPPRIVFYTFS